MVLLDGKILATQIEEQLRTTCKTLRPLLAIVVVGDDLPTLTYVNKKVLACERVGITAHVLRLPDTITEDELLGHIDVLNRSDEVTGFIVQLPLPVHISTEKILCAIDYRKDVDGLTPTNVGRMALNMSGIVSATPRGILTLLRHYEVPTDGRHVVVVGRSVIVGRPLSILLSSPRGGNATVTVCHTHTAHLADITRSADILITAAGHAGLINASMVKEGAAVIDVGMNRVDGHLVGDVDFPSVAPKCAFITPVPGGVGPMTVISLLQNVVDICLKS